jgi:CPA1 family monovalent cation:H+ antiporter
VLDVLTFVLAAVAVIVVLQFLADRTGLPTAALLTVAGLVFGVLPGPNVTLDPHVILTFVIPPARRQPAHPRARARPRGAHASPA